MTKPRGLKGPELKSGSSTRAAFIGFVHRMRAESPNDLKLSDRGARRGTCMVGGKAAVEAGAVTCGAVRCSAWLGDGCFIDALMNERIEEGALDCARGV